MESASTLPSLPSFENLRPGQRDVVDRFRSGTSVVAQLPTGYGKTRTAACSYLMLRARGIVNRLLYVVPRSAQARQAAEDVPRDIRECGEVETKSWEVGLSPIPAIKAHRMGSAEVFVVTVQALVSSPRAIDAIADLMSTGRWFVVVDEHHHYGSDEDAVWSQRINSLPYAARLAMSATPGRADGVGAFGHPDVKVSYLKAREGLHVKRLVLHAYDYRVDAVTVSGDIVSFTTSEMFADAGGEDSESIEKFIASRQMKWSPKYISPLVLFPVERLIDLKVSGVRGQMLVQAMSCSHARMVCEQIKTLIPSSMTVDWVGTGPNGRTDDENKIALRAFCPPKDSDGRRKPTLDILVNVGMAGEGLDSTNVTEVVFLTSPNRNNTTLQIIGRGARVIRDQPKVGCVINVDSASELAPLISTKIMEVFDVDTTDEDRQILEREEREDWEPLPTQDDPDVGIKDVSLVEIRKDPMFLDALKQAEVSPLFRDLSSDEREREVFSYFLRFTDQRHESFNQTSLINQLREKCNGVVQRVAGRILRREADGGRQVEKSRKQDILKQINGRAKRSFGAVDTNDEETLRQRYKWLAELDRAVVAGEIPPWLR